MLPCRSRILLNLECWNSLLRPCAKHFLVINQNREFRQWRTWPNDWLPFQWQKPELSPGYFESGDKKEGLDKVDLDQLKPMLKDLKILEKAPESVRKMYTLRFARRKELKILQNEEYTRSLPIRRRYLDHDGYEKKVIRLTNTIRHMRKIIREEAPNSAGHKIAVSRFINKRYKFLCELYRMDRETCNMLCEKLEIDFKPPIPYHWPYPFLERKRTIRETCEKYCKDLKQKKIDEYRKKLEEEQIKFKEEKEKTLQWINQTMSEFKITEDMLQDKKPPLHFLSQYEFLE